MDKVKKELRLSPEHFQLNERGELVIRNAEIVDLVKSRVQTKEPDTEAGGISVELSIITWV